MENIIIKIGMAFILVAIIAIIILVSIFRKNSTTALNGKIEQLESEIETIRQLSGRPGPPGNAGGSGPRGPPGPAGGTFAWQGPLRNLSNTDMFADRMYNTGPYSVAYLDKPNFKTQQQWVYGSDKTLKNAYGGCLYGDPATNLVYMNNCSADPAGIKWLYDNNGRLRLDGEPEKCLTPVYQGIFKDVVAKGDINAKGKDIGNLNKFVQLKLTECEKSIPLSQQWAFF